MMLNPEIIKKDGAYDAEEVCLSLLGGSRKCKCNFSEANAPEQSGAFVYAERGITRSIGILSPSHQYA